MVNNLQSRKNNRTVILFAVKRNGTEWDIKLREVYKCFPVYRKTLDFDDFSS
jgi:hypothetical protein